jgi:hypothetical protein
MPSERRPRHSQKAMNGMPMIVVFFVFVSASRRSR